MTLQHHLVAVERPRPELHVALLLVAVKRPRPELHVALLLVAVERPRPELHVALLLVEREVSNVDRTGTFVDGRWNPQHVAVTSAQLPVTSRLLALSSILSTVTSINPHSSDDIRDVI